MKEKQLLQDTIDRLLYCPNYIEALKELNSRYNPHINIKFTNDVSEFRFPLDKAI